MEVRKGLLSGDHLKTRIREEFEAIVDHRRIKSVKIPLADALMSAYAIFSLKFPSLLQFEEEIRKRGKVSNLRSIYRVEQIPSDTQMREILDEVEPNLIRKTFSKLFRQIQRGNSLKKMKFYKDYYLMSLDGTGYFSSGEVHCDRCLQKKRTGTGETICYFHQMVVGQLVKPGLSAVIPFCPEPVQMQDGKDKNDSEHPAVGRFLKNFREDHPQLKVIVLADSLMSNGKQVTELRTFSYPKLCLPSPEITKICLERLKQVKSLAV